MVKKLADLCLGCIACNLDSIPSVGKYLPVVYKEILIERLTFHDMLTPAFLPHVTYNLFSPSLRTINFYKSEQLSDHVLKHLGDSGCKLTEIIVKKCPNVTDLGIQYITSRQHKLESLELVRLHNITNKALSEVRCRFLKKVNLRECISLTTDGIQTLVTNNVNISSLKLSDCPKLDCQVTPIIAQGLKKSLEELNLDGVHSQTDNSILYLAEHCPNLQSLSLLGANKVTGYSIEKVFRHCPKLSRLDVSYCRTLQSPPHTVVFDYMPVTMQELSLCGVYIDEKELLVSALRRLDKLRVIRLCGVTAVTNQTLKEILKHIGSHLQELDLSGCFYVGDEGLEAVTEHCKYLTLLALTHIPNVSGERLIPIFMDKDRADRITQLHLSCRQLVSATIEAAVTHCHNLEHLDLSGLSRVNDDVIIRLAENSPKLAHLGLKGCREKLEFVEILMRKENRVSDLSISLLGIHCPLKTLSLSGLAKLTDSSVFALANSCHYLEEIYLNGCANITKAALQYLKDSCINRVAIGHKVFNVSSDNLGELDSEKFSRADLLPTSSFRHKFDANSSALNICITERGET